MEWKFKDKIFYQKEVITQDSRKFEILVEEYLQTQYPFQNWKLTKATRDGNRDIENRCQFNGKTMWAEVKYTTHTEQNLSSRKYDSTLVSSVFEENLIKIFFITNTTVGSSLISRVKNFYYLSPIKKIAFVDGYMLAYWIKKNPKIEKKYFKDVINFTIPEKPTFKLQCIRMICKKDSFTLESILEGESVYPLYLSKNYILEGEFIAFGYENKKLQLYCNDKLVFNQVVNPEITTFSIDINDDNYDIRKEYNLNQYYILNNKRYECGNYRLKFAVLGKIFQHQMQAYIKIDNEIKLLYKKIYNIFGPENSGKSWIMNNLKNDMLKNATEDQRIIYVNFRGEDSDVADICRIIFILMTDFYNLEISMDSLLRYANENNERNSFLNYKNIKSIVYALKENNYFSIQNSLKASIGLHTDSLFKTKNSFSINRIFFIDNIHLLNRDNLYILNAILKSFDPLKNVSFVLTSRTKIKLSNTENIYLGYIEKEEILSSINEVTSFKINNLNEVLPRKNFLEYPGLLHVFLHEIRNCLSEKMVKEYYLNSFLKNAMKYEKNEYNFDNEILLLICIVKEGIPFDFFTESNNSQLFQLINTQLVKNKDNYIFPNFEKWNKNIPEENIQKYKDKLINSILKLINMDNERKILYECALVSYFREYYNYYFSQILLEIKNQFDKNQYFQVIYLCKTLLEQQNFYCGNIENLDKVRYFLAFSYMHCDASKNAKEIFEEITNRYQMSAKKSIYFDAKAEIIDFEYWEFENFSKLPQSINKFRKEWKTASLDIVDLSVRAYLTATNRMMVTYLALDCIRLAKKWFKKNIKLAFKYNAKEHIGYTYMDYAKGIYHINLSLALKYLQIADSYFNVPSEKRRHLDCLCEIEYVKALLGIGSIQQLLLAQEQLFENQYWIQYYKCDLKIALFHILRKDMEKAKQSLLEVEASTIMENNKRVNYFTSIFNTFLYKETVTYNMKGIAGTTYQYIIENNELNYKCNVVEIFVLGEKKTAFYLDPRVW